MVRGFNRKKTNNLCMKVDLHKAYDKINTEFISHMLLCIGFSKKFAYMVYERISTINLLVLLNGNPLGYFNKKGNKVERSFIFFSIFNCNGIYHYPIKHGIYEEDITPILY